jgi:PUA domain protein
MRPGIVSVDDAIKEGDVIVIIDEKHSKPLAIGIALSDADKMREQTQGKSVKNLHYVGDKLWTL